MPLDPRASQVGHHRGSSSVLCDQVLPDGHRSRVSNFEFVADQIR